MVIGCIVILILILTIAGVAFAIQLSSGDSLLSGGEGKETVTETFEWSATEGPKKEDEADDRITTQEGVFSPRIVGTLDFGDSSQSYDVEFPSKQFPLLLKNNEKGVRMT